MWVAAPDQNVSGLLSSFAPFNKFTRFHAILSRGAMLRSFNEWDIIPPEEIDRDGILIVAVGEMVLQRQEDSRKPIARITTGSVIFFLPAVASSTELVALSSLTLLLLSPAASALIRKEHALREALYSGPVRPEEIWFACAAEASRRGLESSPAFDAAFGYSVLRYWPLDAELIAENKDDYIWIVAAADAQKAGEGWNPERGPKWARLLGFPTTALKNCKKLEVPRKVAVPPAPETPSLLTVQESPSLLTVQESPPLVPVPLRAPRWRRLKKIFWRCMVLLGVAALIWGVKLHLTPSYSTKEFSGRLVFDGLRESVSSKISGKIFDLKVAVNEKIDANTTIATLEPPQYKEKVEELTRKSAHAKAKADAFRVFFDGKVEVTPPPDVLTVYGQFSDSLRDLRVRLALELNQTTINLREASQKAQKFFDGYRDRPNSERWIGWITGAELAGEELKRFYELKTSLPSNGDQPSTAPSVAKTEFLGRDNATDEFMTKLTDVAEAEDQLETAQGELKLAEGALTEARLNLSEAGRFSKKSAQEEARSAQSAVNKLRDQVANRAAKLKSARDAANSIAKRSSREVSTPRATGALPLVATGETAGSTEATEATAAPVSEIDKHIQHFLSLLNDLEAALEVHAKKSDAEALEADEEVRRIAEASKLQHVSSKFAGTIEKTVAAGADITAGAQIVQLIKEFRWKAEFDLPQAFAAQVQKGTEVVVKLRDSETKLTGRVTNDPKADGRLTVALRSAGEHQNRVPIDMVIIASTEIKVITGDLLTKTIQELFR